MDLQEKKGMWTLKSQQNMDTKDSITMSFIILSTVVSVLVVVVFVLVRVATQNIRGVMETQVYVNEMNVDDDYEDSYECECVDQLMSVNRPN